MIIYSVYVGHYQSPAISKADLQKLNKLGVRGYLFSMNNFYTLKVNAFVNNPDAAYKFETSLKSKGLDAYILTKEVTIDN